MRIIYDSGSGGITSVDVPDSRQNADETEQDFAARIAAEVVPHGVAHIINPTVPDFNTPPELWDVDWQAGTVGISAAALAADLAAKKLDANRRVSARADEISESVTGIAPLSEKLSWQPKEDAAIAFQANSATSSQLAMLNAEAAVTGETVAELCVKILANSEQRHAATGAIAGLRRTTMAAIDALTDHVTFEADLAAILATAEATAATLLNAILNPQ